MIVKFYINLLLFVGFLVVQGQQQNPADSQDEGVDLQRQGRILTEHLFRLVRDTDYGKLVPQEELELSNNQQENPWLFQYPPFTPEVQVPVKDQQAKTPTVTRSNNGDATIPLANKRNGTRRGQPTRTTLNIPPDLFTLRDFISPNNSTPSLPLLPLSLLLGNSQNLQGLRSNISTLLSLYNTIQQRRPTALPVSPPTKLTPPRPSSSQRTNTKDKPTSNSKKPQRQSSNASTSTRTSSAGGLQNPDWLSFLSEALQPPTSRTRVSPKSNIPRQTSSGQQRGKQNDSLQTLGQQRGTIVLTPEALHITIPLTDQLKGLRAHVNSGAHTVPTAHHSTARIPQNLPQQNAHQSQGQHNKGTSYSRPQHVQKTVPAKEHHHHPKPVQSPAYVAYIKPLPVSHHLPTTSTARTTVKPQGTIRPQPRPLYLPFFEIGGWIPASAP